MVIPIVIRVVEGDTIRVVVGCNHGYKGYEWVRWLLARLQGNKWVMTIGYQDCKWVLTMVIRVISGL